MLSVESSVVCYACNERMEREKAWLFLRGPVTGPHNWSHTLVSVPGPEVITAETEQEKTITLEERVARVEAKIDTRLAGLEDLLKTLLAK